MAGVGLARAAALGTPRSFPASFRVAIAMDQIAATLPVGPAPEHRIGLATLPS